MVIYPHELSESASDYAYRILYTNIIKMVLVPKTIISPVELSKKLSISRTPIQVACSRLANEGLLTVIPQRGSFVSIINLHKVFESIYMRNIHDQIAARYICKSKDSSDVLIRLEANLKQQEFYADKNFINDVMELDNQFHDIIYEFCRMNNIRNALEGISVDQNRVRYMKIQSHIRVHETVNEHRELIDAIKSRDIEKSILLSYMHVSKFGEDIEAIYNKNPDYFSQWSPDLLTQFNCNKQSFYIMENF